MSHRADLAAAFAKHLPAWPSEAHDLIARPDGTRVQTGVCTYGKKGEIEVLITDDGPNTPAVWTLHGDGIFPIHGTALNLRHAQHDAAHKIQALNP